MVVVDEETADLLIKLGEVICYDDPRYQYVLDYIFSGLYLERYPSGRMGGFSDVELKKWLRANLAGVVKILKNRLFEACCPKCGVPWLQIPRTCEEEYVECPTCHARIRDPEVLRRIPLESELPFSLDELSEEHRSKLPEEMKEMITFNEGFRYGEAAGWFDEWREWLKRYYVREEKRDWREEKIVEVSASEAEIIKKLKQERGFSDEEIIVAIPKLRSFKSSEEMLLAVLFSIENEVPLTQHQLANILKVTQPRVSQLLTKYEGKLILVARIENPEGHHKRKSLQGYYMPREVKEKLTKTLLPTNTTFKHVRPLAEKHPELAWRKGVLT